MKYRFARFENDVNDPGTIEKASVKRYEFDSLENAQAWVNEEIERFKKVNHVRDELNDKSFIRFKSELQESLDIQKG